jgi:hypothetical protein
VRLALFAVVMGIAAGLFARGSLRNLVQARFRSVWLLALYLVGTIAARFELRYSFALLLIGMLAFVVFAFRNALPVPGMAIVGLGLLLNLIVTANNGGMPYRPSAVVSAGAVSSKSADLIPKDGVVQHAERESDQLMMFADVLPLRPLREVVSIGDVLVALGLGLVAFSAVAGSIAGAHSQNAVTANQPTALIRLSAGDQRAKRLTPTGGSSGGSPQNQVSALDSDDDWSTWQSKVISLADGTTSRATGEPTDPEVVHSAEVREKLDEWDHRIQLLKATGDITVVLDLVSAEDRQRIEAADDADPDDEHSATARLAVARAMRATEVSESI